MRLILLSVSMFSCSLINAQFLAGGGINFHTPLQEQSGKLKNAYGLVGTGEYYFKKTPLFAIVDASWSVNGIKDIDQDVTGPNGYTTTQPVNYTSSLFLLTGGFGIAPLQENNVSPYIAAKGGYLKYRTVMSLPDPNDPDGCRALDTENITKDITAVGSLGTGVKFKIKHNHAEKYLLDFGFNYLVGGKARYLEMGEHHDTPEPTSDPYYIKFQNVQSGDVHEHHLGQIHHTKTRQLQVFAKFSVLFR